jgi:hypothetical protein
MSARHSVVLLGLVFAAMPAWAEEDPKPRPSEQVVGQPPAGRAPGNTEPPESMTVRHAPKKEPAQSSGAGGVQTKRAPDEPGGAAPAVAFQLVEVAAGQATVRVGGGERTLKPGDAIGTDTVRSIDSERLVLTRVEGPGREAMVIVTFDAQRNTRALVLSTRPSAGDAFQWKPAVSTEAPPAR